MADRYESDRWRGDDDRYREERDMGRDRDDRGRWFDRDRGPDRDRGDRGLMDRGADEVRSWFGDERAERRREMDEQRDRVSDWRDRFDRQQWGSLDPDGRARASSAQAGDRHHSGYYDSSMGYASVPTDGNLNPLRYRGPGSFAGRGPRNYQRSDERIREDVVMRLTEDDRVDASDIDVSVQNGEVRLSGTVQNRRMRRAAEECIEDMPGVRDVHNELRVDDKAGALGHAGSPLEREDVTSLDISGAQAQAKR